MNASPQSFSDRLVRRLAGAERVAVLTGAGVSAESGVPTFRDEGGLWEQFSPQELANVEAFLDNPELVQGWYTHRREVVNETEPNPAHRALADLEALVLRRGGSFLLATQNVDDLHRQAGSERVVELHGNITRSYCIDCERAASEGEMRPDRTEERASEQRPGGERRVATCPDCGGLLRPDVVWFGEQLPAGAMAEAQQAAAACDVFLSVGTSAVVYPAAGLPLTAAEHGAYTAEVNPERSAVADALDEVLLAKAGVALPSLVKAVREQAPA